MAIIPEEYKRAVAAIGVHIDNEDKWIGTGFFAVRKIDDDKYIPMLVTNKHVLKNLKKIILRFTKKGSETIEKIEIPIGKNNDAIYYEHPNEKIDIAVLKLSGQFIRNKKFQISAFDIDMNAFTSKKAMEEGAEEGSLVYMLGFPMGLVDIHSLLPICRLGCIARLNDTQLESYNFLLDIQNFPGNSGSPIITRPELMTIKGTKSLDKSMLIGIVRSFIPYQDALRSEQTNQIVEIRTENSGIALVHPVEYIREVVDQFQKPIL